MEHDYGRGRERYFSASGPFGRRDVHRRMKSKLVWDGIRWERSLKQNARYDWVCPVRDVRVTRGTIYRRALHREIS